VRAGGRRGRGASWGAGGQESGRAGEGGGGRGRTWADGLVACPAGGTAFADDWAVAFAGRTG
jgi:hypothetical protein